jgi:hypothetical protein
MDEPESTPLSDTVSDEQSPEIAKPAGKPKKRTGRRIFLERMKAEGRYKEYIAKVKARKAETGQGWSVCTWPVMREMGYLGPQGERNAEVERLQKQVEVQAETIQAVRGEKVAASLEEKKLTIRQEALRRNFEEAVASLPPKAPYQEEIDWIRAHPAMMRQARSHSKKGTPVNICADDVLCAPHGKAPSHSAVYMLAHWSNNPAKFFEKILDEHKKLRDAAGGKVKGATVDHGISEIETLLNSLPKE